MTYRVRLATESEIIARARRNGSAGAWLVERFWPSRYDKTPGAGQWNSVSNHITEEAANKAMARAVRKSPKGEQS